MSIDKDMIQQLVYVKEKLKAIHSMPPSNWDCETDIATLDRTIKCLVDLQAEAEPNSPCRNCELGWGMAADAYGKISSCKDDCEVLKAFVAKLMEKYK